LNHFTLPFSRSAMLVSPLNTSMVQRQNALDIRLALGNAMARRTTGTTATTI
jgi:hypothetical protein